MSVDLRPHSGAQKYSNVDTTSSQGFSRSCRLQSASLDSTVLQCSLAY